MTYSTLLFDLDDTVLDFAAAESIALDQICALFFPSYPHKQQLKNQFHTINVKLWDAVALGQISPREVKTERFSQLLTVLNSNLNPAELARSYEKKLGETVIWLPGAQKSLTQLREHYKIGFITNGLATVQEKKYELTGIHEWCSCFIISEKVGLAKPDRRMFDLAFEKLGVLDKKALMIGDSLLSDYQGAINAGLDFCWINPTQAPCPPSFPPPKYTLKSVAELPKSLKLK